MDTKLFNLPDDFGTGVKDNLVYFYSTGRSSIKNKVNFSMNMLCLLQQGVKEVQTATQKVIVSNREILMLSHGSTLMSESLADDGHYEAVLIFFSNDVLVDFCAGLPLVLSAGSSADSVYTVEKDDFLRNYCQSLYLLRNRQNDVLNALKVREILSYIYLAYPAVFQAFVGQALAAKPDVKLKQVVELSLNKGLLVDELAFLCNMSTSTFKRHFAAIYHTSPQKYFNRLKMEQARSLLALQKRPSEIYAALGYASLSAFSNEFKKHFGISPVQLQRKIGLRDEVIELSS